MNASSPFKLNRNILPNPDFELPPPLFYFPTTRLDGIFYQVSSTSQYEVTFTQIGNDGNNKNQNNVIAVDKDHIVLNYQKMKSRKVYNFQYKDEEYRVKKTKKGFQIFEVV